MENTNPTKFPKTPAILLGVVILMAVVFLSLRYRVVLKESPKSFSSENVQLQNVDIENKTGVEKLPAGFPQSIPVELGSITASETLSYPDRKATVYNVSYLSSKQQEELSAIYADYMKNNGFEVLSSKKEYSRTTYVAKKNNSDLSIIITSQSHQMNVLISYVVQG